MYHEDAHVALAVSYWASRDYSRAEDEWRVACENTDTGCRHQGSIKRQCFLYRARQTDMMQHGILNWCFVWQAV